MTDPDGALGALATLLREENSVISPHVIEPSRAPLLGRLVASGDRVNANKGEYAFVVEAVREGYELHYGEPRVVMAADRDLELLAGDYLYAVGLERLAALGDLESVRELSDLISLAARLHDRANPAERVVAESAALWLSAVTAIAIGPETAHEHGKAALRASEDTAAAELRAAAQTAAARAGFTQALDEAAAGLDFRPRVG
jgi:hypothetical protein